MHPLEDPLDGLDVVAIGGADKAVVGDVHQLPQVQHAARTLHNAVHKLLGGDAGLPGLVLNLLAVLVGAGEEHDVLAPETVVAGQGVGGHGAVGVADMELVGGIVDGGGDIELLVFHGSLSFSAAAPNERAPEFTSSIDSISHYSTFLPDHQVPELRGRRSAAHFIRGKAARGRTHR